MIKLKWMVGLGSCAQKIDRSSREIIMTEKIRTIGIKSWPQDDRPREKLLKTALKR